MTSAEHVGAAVDANWEREIEFLRGLVTRRSTLGDEARVQRFVAAELADLGLEVDAWDIDAASLAGLPGYGPVEWSFAGRPNVGARWGGDGGGRSLVLQGHIDVVPATPEHHWTHDPWGAEIDGGRMYGRGAADMKAGVVAMLGAVRALTHAQLKGDIQIETVIEEECTGNGAAACRARLPKTDAAIIPEPFNHAALTAQVGVLWATVTVAGKAAHAERADQAQNAILEAIPVIERIRALEAEVNGDGLRLNYNVGVMQAGDWASSVPEECVLEVRLAAQPGEDLEGVKARFEATGQAPVAWRGFHAQGFEIDPDQPLFEILGNAHTTVHGTPMEHLA